MLRVLHVASGDLWGGAEHQLLALAAEQHRRAQTEVGVVILNPGELRDRLQAGGVLTWLFPEAQWGGLRIVLAIRRAIYEFDPDCVHTHRQKENVLGALAARLAGGAPCLRTVHGAEENTPGALQVGKRLKRSADRWTGRLLQQRVVAVSGELGRELGGTFGENKVVTVENGIDISAIRNAARQEVDIPDPAAVRVAMVGRLVAVKRPDLFLAIAEKVKREVGQRIAFYLYGTGPLAGELEERITELGLQDTVHLMGFRSDLPAHLARMHVLLVLSDHEGLPLNVLEAQALGVPVIAHAVGGIVNVLDGGRNGTLLHTQDPRAYAKELELLLRNPTPYRERAQSGRQAVEAAYGIARVAEEYQAVYRQLRRAGEVGQERAATQGAADRGASKR